MILRVGYSGSRFGMSPKQFLYTEQLLEERQRIEDRWGHHGDCVGGDSQFHSLCVKYGYKTRKHPPLEGEHNRAHCECDSEDKPYSYSGRNQRICLATDFLVATPFTKHETGGTWNTINHARRMKMPHVIIFRDGNIEQQGTL